MSAPAYYEELRALRLGRVLDAAAAIITEQGWDRLSMTEVAQRSGVPRQSLYKEVGTRSDLGAAVLGREVERFLEGVRTAIGDHRESAEDGLVAAARFVLTYGRTSALLQAVLRPGRDPELLELLTVRPEAVLGQAVQAIGEMLGDLSEDLADSVVRLTLSHLLQPTVSIEVAVGRIRFAVHRLLIEE